MNSMEKENALKTLKEKVVEKKDKKKNKKNKKNKKAFRIRSSSLYLTYSQIPELGIDDREYEKLVLRILSYNLSVKIETYLFRIEYHLDGGKHMHCFLKNSTRFDIYSASTLDLDLNAFIVDHSVLALLSERKDKGVLHGNYQNAKSQRQVISYILKDVSIEDTAVVESLVSTYKSFDALVQFKFEKPLDHILSVFNNVGYDAAEKLVFDHYQEFFLSKGQRFLDNLRTMESALKKNRSKMFISPIENYSIMPAKIKNWAVNDSSSKALVLHGPSGTGKTELAKSISKFLLCKDPKIVSDLNSLKQISNVGESCLIFDDLDYDKVSREVQIHLTDVLENRDIRILYGLFVLEAGVARIFTTNNIFNFHDPAVRRRSELVLVDKPLFKTCRFEIEKSTTIKEVITVKSDF